VVTDPQLLSRVPLFSALDPADIAGLSARLRQRRFAPRQPIFLQGDPGGSLCIVESGRVKLALTSAEGREVILDLIGPGEAFGELALLDGLPRSADAIAVEASMLRFLDRDDFVHYVEAHPGLALRLMLVLSQRLRRDAELIQDAVFLDVPARVARTILRLATDTNGVLLTPRLTQADLAGMAGTTRETLNKWLGIYEAQGLIRQQKGRIAVLQAEALHRRIG
jgi:CRP-like cAMP-binding protein